MGEPMENNNTKFVGIRSVSAFTTYHDNSAELRYLVIALDARDERGNRLFVRLAPDKTAELRSTLDRALEGRTHDHTHARL